MLRLLFVGELGLVTLLLPEKLRVCILPALFLTVYRSAEKERRAVALYLAFFAAGFTAVFLLGGVDPWKVVQGLVNVLALLLLMLLLVFVVEPREMDTLALALRVDSSRFYQLLRLSLVLFRTMLRDAMEAARAVKAKERGAMLGRNFVGFVKRFLAALIILADARSRELAENLALYPVYIGRRRFPNGEYVLPTLLLTTALLLLLTSKLFLPR